MKDKIINYTYALFGTSDFAADFLEELFLLKSKLPDILICNPDKLKGRGLKLSEPPAKTWAKKHSLEVWQPEKLDDSVCARLKQRNFDFFCVVSYGKILPETIFGIPKSNTINIHPSLLPKYRGPTPLENQILADDLELGTTIIKIDDKVDHGPIIAQEKINTKHWPMDKITLGKLLAKKSADLFNRTMALWCGNSISPVAQDESLATYTRKIEKKDGLIDLSQNQREIFLKYLAYKNWPGLYFLIKRNDPPMRVKITSASFNDDKLVIEKVIPEGKKEISWNEFSRSYSPFSD